MTNIYFYFCFWVTILLCTSAGPVPRRHRRINYGSKFLNVLDPRRNATTTTSTTTTIVPSTEAKEALTTETIGNSSSYGSLDDILNYDYDYLDYFYDLNYEDSRINSTGVELEDLVINSTGVELKDLAEPLDQFTLTPSSKTMTTPNNTRLEGTTKGIPASLIAPIISQGVAGSKEIIAFNAKNHETRKALNFPVEDPRTSRRISKKVNDSTDSITSKSEIGNANIASSGGGSRDAADILYGDVAIDDFFKIREVTPRPRDSSIVEAENIVKENATEEILNLPNEATGSRGSSIIKIEDANDITPTEIANLSNKAKISSNVSHIDADKFIEDIGTVKTFSSLEVRGSKNRKSNQTSKATLRTRVQKKKVITEPPAIDEKKELEVNNVEVNPTVSNREGKTLNYETNLQRTKFYHKKEPEFSNSKSDSISSSDAILKGIKQLRYTTQLPDLDRFYQIIQADNQTISEINEVNKSSKLNIPTEKTVIIDSPKDIKQEETSGWRSESSVSVEVSVESSHSRGKEISSGIHRKNINRAPHETENISQPGDSQNTSVKAALLPLEANNFSKDKNEPQRPREFVEISTGNKKVHLGVADENKNARENMQLREILTLEVSATPKVTDLPEKFAPKETIKRFVHRGKFLSGIESRSKPYATANKSIAVDNTNKKVLGNSTDHDTYQATPSIPITTTEHSEAANASNNAITSKPTLTSTSITTSKPLTTTNPTVTTEQTNSFKSSTATRSTTTSQNLNTSTFQPTSYAENSTQKTITFSMPTIPYERSPVYNQTNTSTSVNENPTIAFNGTKNIAEISDGLHNITLPLRRNSNKQARRISSLVPNKNLVPPHIISQLGRNPHGQNPSGINPFGMKPEGITPFGIAPKGLDPLGYRTNQFINITLNDSTQVISQNNSKNATDVKLDPIAEERYHVQVTKPDGSINGDYLVLDHNTGSLSGVRYEAVDGADQALIQKALLSFLSLDPRLDPRPKDLYGEDQMDPSLNPNSKTLNNEHQTDPIVDPTPKDRNNESHIGTKLDSKSMDLNIKDQTGPSLDSSSKDLKSGDPMGPSLFSRPIDLNSEDQPGPSLESGLKDQMGQSLNSSPKVPNIKHQTNQKADQSPIDHNENKVGPTFDARPKDLISEDQTLVISNTLELGKVSSDSADLTILTESDPPINKESTFSKLKPKLRDQT